MGIIQSYFNGVPKRIRWQSGWLRHRKSSRHHVRRQVPNQRLMFDIRSRRCRNIKNHEQWRKESMIFGDLTRLSNDNLFNYEQEFRKACLQRLAREETNGYGWVEFGPQSTFFARFHLHIEYGKYDLPQQFHRLNNIILNQMFVTIVKISLSCLPNIITLAKSNVAFLECVQ